jgi:hypothetical protein
LRQSFSDGAQSKADRHGAKSAEKEVLCNGDDQSETLPNILNRTFCYIYADTRLRQRKQNLQTMYALFFALPMLGSSLLQSLQIEQIPPIFSFSITIPDSLSAGVSDGRLILMLSNNNKSEPRFQISDGPSTQLAFGKNVENWRKGQPIIFDGSEFGYPISAMKDVPPGEYYVQALLHKYETFHRADGHVVKLPMDRGEGQQWNRAPGNLYSIPVKIAFDPRDAETIRITLSQKIPPIQEPEDTEYVKHVKMKSELLSKFWGRDMYLGAHVLLPKDWDTHPDVKYPLAIFHGHFPNDFGGWRTTPPDTTVPCVYSDRFKLDCYNRIVQQEAYDFYQAWMGPGFPRVIAIEIQHPTPYYDDSYAVNSESIVRYGYWFF